MRVRVRVRVRVEVQSRLDGGAAIVDHLAKQPWVVSGPSRDESERFAPGLQGHVVHLKRVRMRMRVVGKGEGVGKGDGRLGDWTMSAR